MPIPILFPRSLDGLLYSRKQTIRLAAYAVHQTRHQFRFSARLIDWSRRLDTRIAQVSA